MRLYITLFWMVSVTDSGKRLDERINDMKEQPIQMGIIGCGDFLRWMAPGIKASREVAVKWLFDPARERAERYAAELGGQPAELAEAVFADPEVEIACLFVPPWLRSGLWEQATRTGKHILATKPLAPSAAEQCERIAALAKNAEARGLRSGVLYGSRSGDGWPVALKRLLDSGISGAALYRQDWMHHYPQWNNWALDPAKNGGPFMDAMIHNLNLARYLMGRPVTAASFYSEKLAHPDLTCADTETLKLTFAENGSALLFITWAADLAGRFHRRQQPRAHRHLLPGHRPGLAHHQGMGPGRRAHHRQPGGEQRAWPAIRLGGSVFDRFVSVARSGGPLPEDIVSVEMAAEDIRLLRSLE